MPIASTEDLTRMRGQLFVEGDATQDKLSRYWILLVLAGIIASAGVVADSTATVIGAMIVAPLMTPILAIVLSIVLGDRPNLLRSLGLVVTGVAAVIAIGYLVGLLVSLPVTELTNSQVADRVSPRLIDLLAALATGAVGSFAVLRSDVSDTLPGVAIAISLVPPLAVVGLTLESGEPDQAMGALLLFMTNVAAILATGVVVMAIFGVHRVAVEGVGLNRRNAVLVVAALVVVILVPLISTTVVVATNARNEQQVYNLANSWADADGWDVVDVTSQHGTIVVRAIGEGDGPDPKALRSALDDAGLDDVDVRVDLIPEQRVLLDAD